MATGTPIQRVRRYLEVAPRKSISNAEVSRICKLTPAQVAITLFNLRKTREVRKVGRGTWRRK